LSIHFQNKLVMKKLFYSILFFASSTIVAIAQNGAQLEYTISSASGASGSIKAMFAAGNSRVEMQMIIPQMPGGGFTRTSILKSNKPSTSYTLDDKTKTYTTSEISKTNNNASCDNCVLKIIGKEKIRNYNCTHATVTKGAETNEFWTTKDIAEFETYVNSNSGNKYMGTNGDYDALKKNGAEGLVVKSITKDTRGGVFTMELTKFEKKELAASFFEIPSDYKPSNSASPAGAPAIDINKLQNMTPEERQKYMEEMKKQYGGKEGGK